ncbi:hypothetical protein C8R46DRAFT_899568, partial [Mycena filopes]
GTRSASTYSKGGGKTITIPVGQPFGGRSAGGGTRDQVNGTSTYGSGVPGRIGGPVQGQGLPYFPVAGQAIPFFFWPVDWGNDPDATAYNSTEYKDTTDSPRPGGALVTASINFTAEPGITFRFLADNQTVTEIIPILNGTTCASNLTLSATLAEWVQGGSPEPKAAVQYFRASSAVLTLDSHDIHIDSTKPTGQLYDCLVEKIAASIPLVDPLPKYSRGEKAGIALGTIAGVALLAGLGWCIICRKGKGGETEHKSGLKLEAGLTKSSPLAGSG